MRNGHRLPEILETYTLDQIELFSKAIQKRELRKYEADAVAARVAQNADAKEWRRFIGDLKPKTTKKPGEAPADALVRMLKEKGLWPALSKTLP